MLRSGVMHSSNQRCVELMEGHVHPHRGWALIRDNGTLTAAEGNHLANCRACNDWLVTFVALSRKAGFHISFEIPEYRGTDRCRAA